MFNSIYIYGIYYIYIYIYIWYICIYGDMFAYTHITT